MSLVAKYTAKIGTNHTMPMTAPPPPDSLLASHAGRLPNSANSLTMVTTAVMIAGTVRSFLISIQFVSVICPSCSRLNTPREP